MPSPRPPPGPVGPVVVVRGEGEVRATPDLAFITLATEHRAQTSKEAQAQGAAAMASVQQRLLAAGVPKDAIRTLSYDLQPQFDFSSGRQVPRGFLARNVIEVRAEVPGSASCSSWRSPPAAPRCRACASTSRPGPSWSARRLPGQWPTPVPGPRPRPKAPAARLAPSFASRKAASRARPMEQPMFRTSAVGGRRRAADRRRRNGDPRPRHAHRHVEVAPRAARRACAPPWAGGSSRPRGSA